ncbi:GAF domain-containing protein [Leptospira sp. 96542]|nr:GAF domain-containing protein [Leptospira sp. 96542]
MGLLDRAEEIQKKTGSFPSKESASPIETPSLLKKAEKFKEELIPSPTENDWLDDEENLSPATEIGDLPNPDGEEDFDLSDIPELMDDFELADDKDPLRDDPFEHLDDIDEIPTNFDSPVENLETPDPEPIFEDEPKTGENLIELEPDEESAPLPEVDLFEEWENDAKKEASKQPLRPTKDDPAPLTEEILFDDESDFGTAPMAYHLASKKRIENYQAIFEITKDIASSVEYSDFFDNLVYSVIGQVGCSSVVIITSTNPKIQKWEAVAAQGVSIKDSWYLQPNDEIYSRMTDSDSVVYAGEFKSLKIPDREKNLLNELNSEVLVPIRHKDKCYGVMSLGKLINSEEYIADDLEFVKIVGDIAGSVFERVSEFEKLNEDLNIAKEVISINEAVLKTARDFARVRKMDEAFDLFAENIREKLGVKQYSFLILDSEFKEDYIVFGSNFILPERAKDFRLSKNSDIVGMVSNIPGVYRLENFREDSELKSIFTNDELGIMNEFTILPIINLNWLVGMIVVHSTNVPWTDTTRDIAVALLETSAPVFANLLILKEKDALFRNPFNPLETRILSEIEKASKMNISFTVTMFKIQNVARMIQLTSAGNFARYADALRKIIIEHISEMDFFTRVGQGKFVMLLHGKDKEETDVVIKKIKSTFAKKEEILSFDYKASYRVLTLSYPKDTKDKNLFLEMIEEA